MYHAKDVGVAKQGSRYVILQDGPASFHVTVSTGSIAIYDYFFNPPSIESLKANIDSLEEELLNKSHSTT